MTATVPPPTCGTCAHWMVVDSLGECALGWEAHDNLLPSYDPKTRQRVPVTMGHGGLELPLTHPDCQCSAHLGLRMGWKARNVTVPSSG